MTFDKQAINKALEKHPDCKYADWQNGLEACTFAPTIVVQLWRNQECYNAGDPPKYTESYLRSGSPF